MTRAVLGLREDSGKLFDVVFQLIRKCIENDQDFMGEMRYVTSSTQAFLS